MVRVSKYFLNTDFARLCRGYHRRKSLDMGCIYTSPLRQGVCVLGGEGILFSFLESVFVPTVECYKGGVKSSS